MDSIQCCLDWFPRCVFTIFWKCWITFDRIDSGITNWLVKLFRCETMIGTCVCNRRENHESIYILYVHYIVCGIENGLFQQGQASQTSGKNYVHKLDSQKVNRLVKHSAEINCFCVFIRAIPRKFRYHISIQAKATATLELNRPWLFMNHEMGWLFKYTFITITHWELHTAHSPVWKRKSFIWP